MKPDLPKENYYRGRKANPDRSSALVFLILALTVGMEAYRLGPGRLGSPGAGLTPLLYASILSALSIILFVRSLRQQGAILIVFRWRLILPILASLLTYGLLIERMGYLACTFVVMVSLSRMGKTGWLGSLIFAIGATLVIHILFVRWLAVPLPVGFIFP